MWVAKQCRRLCIDTFFLMPTLSVDSQIKPGKFLTLK
jgi:hypothetical protein